MYALIGKLAQYGVEKAQELWAEHGNEIIEAGQTALETLKDGAEAVIENIGDIF